MEQFLAYIIWSPSPEIFSNIDTWPLSNIRWYGMLFAIGFIISQQIMFHIFKKEGKPEKDVESLTIYMIVATVIGARLGHVLFYEPDRYLSHPIDILKIWEGGLASHGGAFAILIALYIYVNYYINIQLKLSPFSFKYEKRKQKRPGQSYLWVVDRLVIVVAITGACIRMGNFMNSEIIGKPTNLPFGVVFAHRAEYGLERLNEVESVNWEKGSNTLDENGHLDMLLKIEFKRGVSQNKIKTLVEGNIANILGANEGYYPSVEEHIYFPPNSKIDYTIPNNSNKAIIKLKGIPRHPAQLYESISCVFLFIILFSLWSRKKEHLPNGLLFSIFLIICFGLRFFYEFLKVNQVEFEENIPLNMGQWLSIPLVITGFYLMYKSLTRKGKSSQ